MRRQLRGRKKGDLLVLIYLDTNIIIDEVEKRNRKTLTFFEKLRTVGNWEAVTSIFAIVEAIDVEGQITHAANLVRNKMSWDEIAKQRTKELSQIERDKAVKQVEEFRERNRKVKVYEFKERGWKTALEVMRNLDISAPDALHVATALNARCQIFLSKDSTLLATIAKNPAYDDTLKGATPENIEQIILAIKEESKRRTIDSVIHPSSDVLRESLESIRRVKAIGEILGLSSKTSEECTTSVADFFKNFHGRQTKKNDK